MIGWVLRRCRSRSILRLYLSVISALTISFYPPFPRPSHDYTRNPSSSFFLSNKYLSKMVIFPESPTDTLVPRVGSTQWKSILDTGTNTPAVYVSGRWLATHQFIINPTGHGWLMHTPWRKLFLLNAKLANHLFLKQRVVITCRVWNLQVCILH